MAIKFTILPLEQWKAARIIRFRLRHLGCECNASIVYTRTFNKSCNTKDLDKIDELIIQAVRVQYPNAHMMTKTIAVDNELALIQQCYDGGRPKTNLIIRLLPEIEAEEMPMYVGREIYGYDVHFNLFLDYIGDRKAIPQDVLLLNHFPIGEDSEIRKEVNDVVTL